MAPGELSTKGTKDGGIKRWDSTYSLVPDSKPPQQDDLLHPPQQSRNQSRRRRPRCERRALTETESLDAGSGRIGTPLFKSGQQLLVAL